jgi:hypothetical protein
MWDIGNARCWECGMLGMWDVGNAGHHECGMLQMQMLQMQEGETGKGSWLCRVGTKSLESGDESGRGTWRHRQG